MDDKLEQAAKECANSFILTDFYIGCDIKEAIMEAIEEAFKAGANWQKEQSPWISIDERFPDDKEQVLVSSQIYGKVVLVWDKLGMVWVYPDDNDVYCDWDKVDCWMPIPE